MKNETTTGGLHGPRVNNNFHVTDKKKKHLWMNIYVVAGGNFRTLTFENEAEAVRDSIHVVEDFVFLKTITSTVNI